MDKEIEKILGDYRKGLIEVAEQGYTIENLNYAFDHKKYIGKQAAQSIKTLIQTAQREAIKETEKAFGGCHKCYGKGYSTEFNVTTSKFGVETRPNKINYCTCERGKQLASLNSSEDSK